MSIKIESLVSSGPHIGTIQNPIQDKDGWYVMCEAKFIENKIKVVDIESVINGLSSGLRLRMGNSLVQWSMRLPSSITIDGLSVEAYINRRGDRK